MTGTFEGQGNKLNVYNCDEISFIAAAPIKAGQEVYLSANNTVAIRTLGTQLSIGVVSVGTATAGERVTVKTTFNRVIQGIAKGGTLAVGATVKPNGNTSVADELPEYVATVSGDWAEAIVIKGGVVDTIIEVAILKAPSKV
jgi:hypothetical protein